MNDRAQPVEPWSTTVYRSWFVSASAALETFVVTWGVVGVAAALAGHPRSAAAAGLVAAVPVALRRGVRVSVSLVGSAVVVRNAWRNYRIEPVTEIAMARHGLKGMHCLAFVGTDGTRVKAIAATVVTTDRGETFHRVRSLVAEVVAAQRGHVELRLPADLRPQPMRHIDD